MHTTFTPTPSRFLPWLVVLTAAAFFFYDFIQLNLFNSIDIQLMQTFKLDAVKLGTLSSMFFYAETLFLLPAGLLLDRFSTKKLLLIAAGITTLGTLAFALAPNFFMAAVARFAVGTGGTFCFLGAFRLASQWFPANKMALVTGIVITIGMLGGLVAQTPMAILAHEMGWRYAVLSDAGLGVVVFLAILFIVQDYPAHSSEKGEIANLATAFNFWQSMRAVITNQYNWLCGIYASLLNLPVFLLGALWGIHYLMQVHHLSLKQASIPPMLFFIGTTLGAPAFGLVSDWLGRRVLPMMLGAIFSFLIMVALMLIPHLSFAAILLLFFLMGVFSFSQVIIYPTVRELNSPALIATAAGFASTIIMSSGAIFQPLFGWLMEWRAAPAEINAVAHYSATNFFHAMLIMPIAFLLGLLIAGMIKETYCEQYL